MVEYIVKQNQTLLDIALIVAGDADIAYEIAKENGLSVSDMPAVGQEIKYSGGVVNKQIVSYYSQRGIVPATGVLDEGTGVKYFDFSFDFSFE